MRLKALGLETTEHTNTYSTTSYELRILSRHLLPAFTCCHLASLNVTQCSTYNRTFIHSLLNSGITRPDMVSDVDGSVMVTAFGL